MTIYLSIIKNINRLVVAGEQITIEAVLMAEVLLALLLNLGLLITLVFKKEELTSDAARKGLEKNIRLFWITLLVLSVPLILFILSEVLEHLLLISPYEEGAHRFEELAETLEVAVFTFLDMGFLCAWLLLLKIRGQG